MAKDEKSKGGKAAGAGKTAPGKSGKGAAAAGKGAAPRGKDEQRRARKGERAAAPPSPRPADYKPRMKALYESTLRDALRKEFGYGNVMQVPRLEKIVINMGVGEAVSDRKKVDAA